ncbi:MAG TPA: 16S rRNA (cytosine(1402)-N(4))-methyltransferase, partial [Clostridia bacterium]|nr:16S rRNA (cytosine(1402)-N(4))-methyltransferase [Clostridia bacterium]
MKPFFHIPIMVNEVLGFLTPERGGVFIDGTLGGGGHAKAVLERLPSGSRLIGID